jgi:four helix bundle protein
LRRSSRAVGANIAEAWGKRAYEKHFVSKLTDADAEQYETQHWLEVAQDCGYISKKDLDSILMLCEEIVRILGGMIARADSFCNLNIMREAPDDYFIFDDEYFTA